MNRLLATAGVVLTLAGAAAVGYSVNALWINDSGVGVAQERLAADFEAALTTTLPVPAGFAQDDPTMATVTTTPGEDLAGPDQTTTTTLPALIPEAAPATGQALGRLQIPAAEVDWLIVEGVSPQDLAQGPGHMPGTALPGQPGNAVISGHRTTHGAPFYNLDRLQPGDPITIQTLIGVHTYQVVQVLTVLPGDVWVTNQVPGAWLTLTTCNPRYSARQRLIIFAQLTDGPNLTAIQTTLTGNETPPQPQT